MKYFRSVTLLDGYVFQLFDLYGETKVATLRSSMPF